MLKKICIPLGFSAVAGLMILSTGCDWTGGGGGSDFNTSQGAGVNVNWSGVYFGQIGNRAVANTSGAGAITRLVLSQGGNRVEVVDNQGSRYEGSVGAPGTVSTGSGGVLSAGSTLVEAQITWSGKDEVAGKDVEFVGILHVVAVSDIQGNTKTDSSTDTRNTTTGSVGTNVTQTITESGEGFTNETVVVVTDPNSDIRTTQDTSTTTSTTTFQITEANSQFRLQGTWIESGGVSANVDALSPGGIATITQQSTTETAAQ